LGIIIFLLFVTGCGPSAREKYESDMKGKKVTKDDLNIISETTIDGSDYWVVRTYAYTIPIPKGYKKSKIKFFGDDGKYKGDSPVDSIIVNNKENTVVAWCNGKIVYHRKDIYKTE